MKLIRTDRFRFQITDKGYVLVRIGRHDILEKLYCVLPAPNSAS